MNCQGIREVSYEYLKGWLSPNDAEAVEAHLAACPACMADTRSADSSLALLKTLPEIEALPETWNKIEARLAVPAPKTRVFRFWLRVAAAASILVAVLSFAVLFMPRTGALPVVLETRKALALHEPFRAEQVSTLSIPDVGNLKVNENSVLRFTSLRSLVLESGEVFAEIDPSGRGFEIRTAEATARVRGTRFGVRAPSTIYVVEGRVEVRSPRGRLELGPNQAAVGNRLVEVSPADYLQWLVRHERPAVRLRLDPRDQTTITPGSPLKWHLILETDALAPLYLEDLRDVSQFVSLTIDGRQAALDPARASVRATRAPNGRVRLDVSHPCVIECAVDPSLFSRKGRIQVAASFTSGTREHPDTWVGIVQSNPITVEVR